MSLRKYLCDNPNHRPPCRRLERGEVPTLRLLSERASIAVRRREIDHVEYSHTYSHMLPLESAYDFPAVEEVRAKWISILERPIPAITDNPDPTIKSYIRTYNPKSLYEICLKKIVIKFQEQKYVNYVKSIWLPRSIKNEFLEFYHLLYTSRSWHQYKDNLAFLCFCSNNDDDDHDILHSLVYIWEYCHQYQGLPSMRPYMYKIK